MDLCLRRPMKQTLRDTVGGWKRVARKKLLSQLGYHLIARRRRCEDGIELQEKLKSHADEARVKLGDDSEDDVLRAWRVKPIKDIVSSERKENNGFGLFKEDNLYFKIAMTLEKLEESCDT